MKRFIIFLFAFVLAISFSGSFLSADYYVKQDGTEDYTTIQACANVVQSGDTCFVYPGTYNERVILTSGGLPGQEITFKALPRRTVIMQGFQIKNLDYIGIEGFNITNTLLDWNKNQGIFLDNANNLEIIDNYFYDLRYNYAIGYSSAGNVIVRDNFIERSNAGIFASGYNWLVENNEINRLIQGPGGTDADYSRVFGENIIFRNNYFHGTDTTPGGEIGLSHVDCFQNWHYFGNNLKAKNIIIENNICNDAHEGIMERDVECEGPWGTSINNYYLYYGTGSVVDIINGQTTATLIPPINSQTNNPYVPLWHGGLLGRKIIIEGVDYTIASIASGFNLNQLNLERPYEGISGSSLSYEIEPCVVSNVFSNWTIRNNVWAHIGSWGVDINFVNGITFIGNTLHNVPQYGIGIKNSKDVIIKNNIISNSGNAAIGLGTNYIPNDIDYNLYYDYSSTYAWINDIGPNSILDLNPLFVDSSNNDFHLQSTSPAIDNGTDLSAYFTTDKDGISRPQGLGWDIGAYEYISGSTSSCGEADTSGNSIIEIGELINYISSWKSGTVLIGELIIAIGEWKNGCV